MKTIEKTCTIYQSFDGKEFMDEKKCAEYEASKVSEIKVNLRNFTIEFPMQDSFTSCRAFLVKSENEFEMLEAYIFNEYYNTYSDYIEFQGCGWYVVQGDDGGSANLYKLSDIIKDWSNILQYIFDNIDLCL